MHWSKVDKIWADRLGKKKEGDISWKAEQWPVPGEDPLEVRVCSRTAVPIAKYANVVDVPRTSIVLHQTEGYGPIATLMGSAGHDCSAHIVLGRCGTPYVLVPTGYTAWHATWWNDNSIGIEIDCIGELYKVGDNLVSMYSNRKDVYCAVGDKDVYVEKQFTRSKHWASLTEKQYVALGKLIKALCFKHQIPRILLPEPQRYQPFNQKDHKVRRDYRGICTHLNIDPARKVDIGPYLDWPKVIQYAGLTEADCFHPPSSVLESWKDGTGGKVAKEEGGGAAPAGGAASGSGAAAGSGAAGPKPPAGGDTLPAPVMIDNHTLRVHIGKHGGRLCLSVKQPGDPLPTTPEPGQAPAAKAPGKRDEFIQACMNFLGAPYKAGSKNPALGIDGANMIGIAMRRVGLFKSDDETPTDAEHLSALWHLCSADPRNPPEEILPGDLVWFGQGNHDNLPLQHPMVYLGGMRVLGPIASGAADSAVQVVSIDKVTESFAGWMHVDDFGTETTHSEHPGEPPKPGAKMTAALLPATPAARYDALKKLVERAKGKWEEGKGKVNLVGVKNLHDRCLISPKPDDWNDTLFAAFLDQDGHKCCLDLRASLNPGTDVNRTETWQLWEGSYKFKLGAGESTQGKALQPDGKVKGWLDSTGMGAPRPTDHDQPASGEQVQPGAPKGQGDDKTAVPKPVQVPKSKNPPPADKPFVFDNVSKKLSMKFGLRMMRALIDWELRDEGGERKGCVYSWNGVVKKYKAPPGITTEWPALDDQMMIKPASQSPGGVSMWKAFGITWGASGATNCCNSQMAAIFASLADGHMRIKKSDGLLDLDVVKGTPNAPDIKDHPPDGKNPVSYSSIFSNVWIQAEGSKYRTKDNKKLFAGYDQISPAWAMKWLGVGENVGKWGDEKMLVDVRMGDNACWFSHNWLVGDIRYEVTLDGLKTPVYVDQSDFVRFEHAQPQPHDNASYKMTRENCLWVEQHEEEFEARLQNFLKGSALVYEGKEYPVKKLAVQATRVFSANCVAYDVHGTASGVVYTRSKEDDGSSPDHWQRNDEKTKGSRLGLGVSRPWSKFSGQVRKGFGNCWGFARWYDNAGGAEWNNG